jgi:hypothetical protein
MPYADKATLVEQYTHGRTTHLHETTANEYRMMCEEMERVSGYEERRKAYQQRLRKQRSVCLKLLQKLGVNTTDWSIVDNFCCNPRVLGKRFAQLDEEELGTLQVKLRMIERHGGLKPKTVKRNNNKETMIYIPLGGNSAKA